MKYYSCISLLTILFGIIPTFAAPYIEISPRTELKKISANYKTYENDFDVLMKSFGTFSGAYFRDISFQNLKKDRNMYQSGTYKYFSQGRRPSYKEADFLDFTRQHPEWSEEEAEKKYAYQKYQTKIQDAKELFFTKLNALPYASEDAATLRQLFSEENFEKIDILLPEYTKKAVANLSIEEKYEFFLQKRTPIPLYETATLAILSPEKYHNFPEILSDYQNHRFSISGWRNGSLSDTPPQNLFTNTHVTETYEIQIWKKEDFNIRISPIHDYELFQESWYFQKQMIFIDPIWDIYNTKVTIQPKMNPKFFREGYPKELISDEWPGMRAFISEVQRKHQLAEYHIPIKEYYGDARMDFWENNELEIHDAYSPCNTTIITNTCISHAIYPYYEADISLPIEGEYILTIEYDTYQPAIKNQNFHDRVFSQERTVLFEEKSIPKTIKKKVSDFIIPKKEK